MEKFNQTEYVNKYMKEKYDIIKVQLKKGEKETIEEHYKKHGFKSMNAYIKYAIKCDMENAERERGGVIGNG